MADETGKRPQELAKNLDNFEVTELDDKDLEGASGGGGSELIASGNENCGCGGVGSTGGDNNTNCGCP